MLQESIHFPLYSVLEWSGLQSLLARAALCPDLLEVLFDRRVLPRLHTLLRNNFFVYRQSTNTTINIECPTLFVIGHIL